MVLNVRFRWVLAFGAGGGVAISGGVGVGGGICGVGFGGCSSC